MGAAHHTSRFVNDLTEGLECSDDRIILEGDLSRDPLVVDVGSALSEHDVFDPIGSQPPGCSETLDRETPGGVSIVLHSVREIHHLVPR